MTDGRSNCRLCEEPNATVQSHIVPSFVFKWIKNTSATGYLRSTQNNKRIQDGLKSNLLCGKCEQIFARAEKEFATHIFHPFTKFAIDRSGFPTGKDIVFQYDEWLIKFVISVQWRTLVFRQRVTPENEFGGKWINLILECERIWRDFLLGRRDDTGPWESHLIFLYNIESVPNVPVDLLPENVNTYLLRSVDFDYAASSNKLAQFSKIGPIVIWTYLKPNVSRGMRSSRIRKRCELSPTQRIGDHEILKFLVLKRPHEAAPAMVLNEAVVERVTKSFKKNPARAVNSMSYALYKSEQRIAAKRKKK